MDVHSMVGMEPPTRVLATLVRQFAGSRVERQLLTQVFDLVWQCRGGATAREVLRDRDEDVPHRRGDCVATITATEGGAA
jgi:hypothetical protein